MNAFELLCMRIDALLSGKTHVLIAIDGPAASGKTTLALIACGMLIPDSGSVSTMPLSQYCAQSPNHPPGNLEDFALSYDDAAMRLRRDLSLDDEWAWRYETLSSGQQKRLQVSQQLELLLQRHFQSDRKGQSQQEDSVCQEVQQHDQPDRQCEVSAQDPEQI